MVGGEDVGGLLEEHGGDNNVTEPSRMVGGVGAGGMVEQMLRDAAKANPQVAVSLLSCFNVGRRLDVDANTHHLVGASLTEVFIGEGRNVMGREMNSCIVQALSLATCWRRLATKAAWEPFAAWAQRHGANTTTQQSTRAVQQRNARARTAWDNEQ